MSNPSDNKPFHLRYNTRFLQARPEDDLLHPDSFKDVKHDSATETQYFGFSVPEANIHALTYMWHHPNLKVCSGGLYVFQGVKDAITHAEICNWYQFMSDACLKNDLHEFRFDNGYGVKLIEPLKLLHMTYDDPVTKSSVDLMFEGVQPAVMFDDGKHFEQTMKVTGELVLRGKRYEVNCFNVRDRSWGKPRPEEQMELSPCSWITGVFNEDFAFGMTVFDHASKNPGPLALPDDKAMMYGWVYRDGKLGRVVKASKRAIRQPRSTKCAGLELQFTDDHGREFNMSSTLVASCPNTNWQNLFIVINLMRWDCDGLIGYGDNQEGFWTSYLNSESFLIGP